MKTQIQITSQIASRASRFLAPQAASPSALPRGVEALKKVLGLGSAISRRVMRARTEQLSQASPLFAMPASTVEFMVAREEVDFER